MSIQISLIIEVTRYSRASRADRMPLGPSGTYTLNNSYRPIFFHEFVTRDKARRRYWYQIETGISPDLKRTRSFLGYPPVQRAKPNFTHRALAKLSIEGVVKQHITQNVDT